MGFWHVEPRGHEMLRFFFCWFCGWFLRILALLSRGLLVPTKELSRFFFMTLGSRRLRLRVGVFLVGSLLQEREDFPTFFL